MKEIKTNAMRILDKLKIAYEVRSYEAEIDGEYVPLSAGNSIEKVGVEDYRCFKTIVTKGKSGTYYVFMLPVGKELDLKKCAQSVKEKSVEPITVKELLPLTGYVRGGCSPIGMKKQFSTTIDDSAMGYDKIIFSAGKRGTMFYLSPQDLSRAIRLNVASITA